MGKAEVEKLKEKMKKTKPSEKGARPSTSDSPDVHDGQKTLQEKQAVAEEMIVDAKVYDVENMREQTLDKGYRHDLIVPGVINIPPTVQAERMKMGQHPITGEPWTKEEEKRYKEDAARAIEDHALAVKKSEQKMSQEQATSIQPVPHIPAAHMTDDQRRAMQESQDRGESPVMQARARDEATPERRASKRLAMEKDKAKELDPKFDPEVERELRRDLGEEDVDDEKDPDEVEEDLNKNKK